MDSRLKFNPDSRHCCDHLPRDPSHLFGFGPENLRYVLLKVLINHSMDPCFQWITPQGPGRYQEGLEAWCLHRPGNRNQVLTFSQSNNLLHFLPQDPRVWRRPPVGQGLREQCGEVRQEGELRHRLPHEVLRLPSGLTDVSCQVWVLRLPDQCNYLAALKE